MATTKMTDRADIPNAVNANAGLANPGNTTEVSVAGAAAPATTGTSGINANFNDPTYQQNVDQINAMYDSQLAAQRAQLESAYNQNMSDMEANRGRIREQYRSQRNMNAANYEKMRRNFNQQAMMNGINTGAGSQVALSQNSAYQGGLAQLGASEANANTDLDKQISDLKVKYQGDIQQAIATSDYNRAAALLDEYNQAYSRAMSAAQTRAQYGDFSGYASIYGQSAARQMEKAWLIQNPTQAYAMGKMTPQQYRKITGAWPPGYKSKSAGGGSRSGYRRNTTSTPPGETPPGEEPPGTGPANPFATTATTGTGGSGRNKPHTRDVDVAPGTTKVGQTQGSRNANRAKLEEARRKYEEHQRQKQQKDYLTERWAYAQGLM